MKGKHAARVENRRRLVESNRVAELRHELDEVRARAQKSDHRARYVLGLEAEVEDLRSQLRSRPSLQAEVDRLRVANGELDAKFDALCVSVRDRLLPVAFEHYRQASGLHGRALLAGVIDTFDDFIQNAGVARRSLLPRQWLRTIQAKEVNAL